MKMLIIQKAEFEEIWPSLKIFKLNQNNKYAYHLLLGLKLKKF